MDCNASFAKCTEPANVLEVLEQWKNLNQKAISLINDPRRYDRDSKSPIPSQIDVYNTWSAAVIDTYDIFMQCANADHFSKNMLLLFSEVKNFACNNDISKYGDGFMQIYTSVASALCDIIICDYDYRTIEKRHVVHYLSEDCQLNEVGYYLYNLDSSMYVYMGTENPFTCESPIDWGAYVDAVKEE